MKAIRKINNNVAVCLDANNKELVAFGKGIGFPQMPYEVELNQVSMTFYKLDTKLYSLFNEIPEEVFMISSLIVKKAQHQLNVNLNPNIIFSLADHINFAVMRIKKYKKLKMFYSYDIAQMYPQETKIGEFAVELIREKLFIALPEAEVTNIAIHFVNSQEEIVNEEEIYNEEVIIKDITDMIDSFFNVVICRKGFNYNRFMMHLRYYLIRIKEGKQFSNGSIELIELLKTQQPKVYECACLIANYINTELHVQNTRDELLYLIIHIDRIINKSEIREDKENE